MTCTWPGAPSTVSAHDRYACEDFRLVAWNDFGPMPAVCVERPPYDFNIETIDLPRCGMTGARTNLALAPSGSQ